MSNKSIRTQCAEVKQRIKQNVPLKEELLDFAISIITQVRKAEGNVLLDGMIEKLRAGKPLEDYERHILIDVLLLHTRLGAAAKVSTLTPTGVKT